MRVRCYVYKGEACIASCAGDTEQLDCVSENHAGYKLISLEFEKEYLITFENPVMMITPYELVAINNYRVIVNEREIPHE